MKEEVRGLAVMAWSHSLYSRDTIPHGGPASWWRWPRPGRSGRAERHGVHEGRRHVMAKRATRLSRHSPSSTLDRQATAPDVERPRPQPCSTMRQ